MRYKLRDITPEGMCILVNCPKIYADGKWNYLIVGKRVEPRDVGLEKEVGDAERLVRVPKKLIDEKKR